MRIRQRSRLLLLITMLLGLPLACSRSGDNPRGSSRPVRGRRLPFTEILPDDWEHVETYRLDANNDDEEEWVVFYCFDLSAEAEEGGSPIAGAVYQPDGERPPNLAAYPLRPPDGDYLCECQCTPGMDDVLSGLAGDELVIRDECDEETTRLTIFQWDSNAGEYTPRCHFCGSRVTVDQNEVVVEQLQPGRAQLAMRETYYPCDSNRTYYQPGAQCAQVMCEKEELVFWHGEPDDVMCSPYPEKVVLAFYSHYDEDEQAPTFFAEGQWAHLGQCDTGRCGCFAPRSQVTHVRVTYLEPEPTSDVQDPDRATVGAMVICERRNDAPEGIRYIRWHLVREGDRWYLDHPD